VHHNNGTKAVKNVSGILPFSQVDSGIKSTSTEVKLNYTKENLSNDTSMLALYQHAELNITLQHDQERLLGGSTVDNTEPSPFAVYITALDSDGSAVQRYCSGALLTAGLVITAATCVVDAYGILVYAGENEAGDGVNRAATAIIYPKYSRNCREHDIALLQLASPFKITGTARTHDSFINTVLLPASGTYNKYSNFLGKYFKIYGYGTSAESDTPSDLNYIDVSVQSASECAATAAAKFYRLGANHLCLDSAFGKKGICKGDLGAPVVVQITTASRGTVLVAIATDYFKCSDPAIITKIAPYLPWIRSYVSIADNQG
ncbi:hypothetical protein B566_EDAN006175, partial [Ephemera danica]